MHGLQRAATLALVWSASALAAPSEDADSRTRFDAEVPRGAVIAERTEDRIALATASGRFFETLEIHEPGATFVKLHFSHFELPAGITVEISSRDGSETWRYAADKKDPLTVDSALGDDGVGRFSAMSITGDTAVVRVTGALHHFDPQRHRLQVDSWLHGLSFEELAEAEQARRSKDASDPSLENACGAEQRYGAVCWAASHPWEYARSAAVAKLITSRGEVCTAWRVGSDNHLFTAEHCLGKQSELDGAEIWFNYEAEECGSSQSTAAVKVTGGSLLASDQPLDYALFTVNNFSQVVGFPALGLDTRNAPVGETIWIPQHGLGQPRQISLESDMNTSGLCEVDEASRDGYAPGSDMGYFCDTVTSSSGSPVVSLDTGRALAIHHFGGCLNAGVKFSQIWPEVSGFFGGEVPWGNTGGEPSPPNEPPQPDMNASCSGLDCSFDGSGSSDPDGSIAAFSWSLGDGAGADSASFQHSYAAGGTYEVTLIVEDDAGETRSVSQDVTVIEPNQDPVARISSQCVNTDCQFSGSSSSDADGSVTQWAWTLGDGGEASGDSIDHAYSESGTYTVTLTVEDDDGASDSASHTVTLSAANGPPSAEITYSCEERVCSFDGNGSTDIDGSIDSWSWDFGDGNSGSGSLASHEFAADGQYTVQLTVTDDRNAENSAFVSIEVLAAPPNQPPQAEFSYECTDLECRFEASQSVDSDGTVVSWSWTFGDGATATGPAPMHRYAGAGDYTVRLVVSDDEGAADQRIRTVIPEAANASPNARFTVSCDNTVCLFDASGSSDPDGRVVSYEWTLGDGSIHSGFSFEHDYGQSGDYSVVLTVRDEDGAEDSRSRTLSVEEAHRPVIVLTGEGGQPNGRLVATLRWSGAETIEVDLFRNGLRIATTDNDGKFIDAKVEEQRKSAEYRVCQSDSDVCSDMLLLEFNPR
jgi:PKD repeat protein